MSVEKSMLIILHECNDRFILTRELMNVSFTAVMTSVKDMGAGGVKFNTFAQWCSQEV